MKRTLLLIAFFAITSSSYAMNEKKDIELFKAKLPPTPIYEKSIA